MARLEAVWTRGVANFKEVWPVIRPVLFQMVIAVGGATLIAFGLDMPLLFAAVFAAATLELICARHHRLIAASLFGVAVGLFLGTAFNPDVSMVRALASALIGVVVAVLVAVATTPADPVAEVERAVDPLLRLVSSQVRIIGSALRTGDMAAAGNALWALNDCDPYLRRLDDILVSVRRSAPLARWRNQQDLPKATTTATEVAYAVRHTRTMAVEAWRGVLRDGRRVPPALPPMLDAMADGVAVLRGELEKGTSLEQTRRLLVSSAQWATVLQTEPVDVSSAAVAGSAQAAVVNLLIASGLPLDEAETAVTKHVP